jgi:hypothetical protein
MIKVSFDAVNSGSHGTPGTLMERTYDDVKSMTHFPTVGDEVIIQWGTELAQSSTFVVEKIDSAFWKDSDHVTVWVKNIE